ncbi:hypothetical protein C8Q76DRAFT_732568 [Earliella scabrosa]|nr:hypothetical protein C8Q76DRAFT_732568 [Earliella scabrosa]
MGTFPDAYLKHSLSSSGVPTIVSATLIGVAAPSEPTPATPHTATTSNFPTITSAPSSSPPARPTQKSRTVLIAVGVVSTLLVIIVSVCWWKRRRRALSCWLAIEKYPTAQEYSQLPAGAPKRVIWCSLLTRFYSTQSAGLNSPRRIQTGFRFASAVEGGCAVRSHVGVPHRASFPNRHSPIVSRSGSRVHTSGCSRWPRQANGICLAFLHPSRRPYAERAADGAVPCRSALHCASGSRRWRYRGR